MKNLYFIPVLLIVVLLAGCHCSRMAGTEIATFDGRETSILPGR